MRLAIISTPRSGSTWVRLLTSFLYQIDHMSVHNPKEIDWGRLPKSCVLQIHWHRTPKLVDHLRRHRFRVMTVARHPLDVLVSILHFAQHEVTEQWLEGEGGHDTSLAGADVTSGTFRAYATGHRARALLDVTCEWWSAPGVHRVRYEDLVRGTGTQASRLGAFLGVDPVVRVEDAVAAAGLDRLRPLVTNNHFWQGKPGLWRRLVPPATAKEIAEAQRRAFLDLDYPCDPEADLSAEEAQRNWGQFAVARDKDTSPDRHDGNREPRAT